MSTVQCTIIYLTFKVMYKVEKKTKKLKLIFLSYIMNDRSSIIELFPLTLTIPFLPIYKIVYEGLITGNDLKNKLYKI